MRPARLLPLLLLLSCKTEPLDVDAAWRSGLQLTGFEPLTLVPGVKPRMAGSGLVTETLGYTSVRFTGRHEGPSGGSDVDVALAADVLSEDQLAVFEATWPTLCAAGEGRFTGTAQLEVTSRQTDALHTSNALPLDLACSQTLTPSLSQVDGQSAVQLNAPVTVSADGLLVGDTEGSAWAELAGCFTPEGDSNCTSVGPVEVPITSIDGVARTGGQIAVPPSLVGLAPGRFEGNVRLVNRHASGEVTRSEALPWTVSLLPSRLDAVELSGASMGGIVTLEGAGFVGHVDSASNEGTEVLFVGVFSPDDGGPQRDVDLILVPSWASHDQLHYVLDEQDALGQIVDLRTESGTVTGAFTPRFYLGSDTRSGPTIEGSFRVELLRQVVWLNLSQSYSDGLVAFGLREAEQHLEDRILHVINEVYGGINVDIRRSRPDDYVLFSQVDVTAVDPNGFGLLGYDNSPGKDDGNARLYDHLGGLNALTQQDGYPGYGGVFLESIWAFSLAPPSSINSFAGASQQFDDQFDPVRADLGSPVTAAEAAAFVPLTTGVDCDGSGDRAQQVQCAVWTLGNIVGGTIAHELAHSFGLADPGGSGFHNPSDGTDRLMDGGDTRSFAERARLDGGGEHLCQGNFDYLREILPSAVTDPRTSRSACD